MAVRAEDLLASRPELALDFRHPDYGGILAARAERLSRLTSEAAQWAMAVYRLPGGIAQFITDWGCTHDPRNIEIGQPAHVPFVLWPKQREWVDWVMERWRGRDDGITEKSRDSGVTWLAVAIACSLCMLYPGVVIGFGSRKQEYVDEKGAPKSIFEKIRAYMRMVPPAFRGSWDETRHAPYMRVFFPATSSVITGECGDSIGRGDRSSLYFVDEAAHLEHPQMADQALSQTTNCRIDISTPYGMANSFAIRRHSGKLKVFTFSWRDDPRKDAAWYAKMVEKYDPVTVAQEIDCSYTASVEGIIIPTAHVQAAVDAHVKLNWNVSGVRRGALDVADEGKNLNAFAARHGNLIVECVSWSGRGSGLEETTEKAFGLCDTHQLDGFDYDADGGGAHVKDDARRIAERRSKQHQRALRVDAFRGSGKVHEPERKAPGTDITNEDRYQNAKAQAWDSLARRFRNTWLAVNGKAHDPENLISLSSKIRELAKLSIELSQPQWKISTSGKLMVDKVPDGALSPDLADAVMMAMAPKRTAIKVNAALLQERADLYRPA